MQQCVVFVYLGDSHSGTPAGLLTEVEGQYIVCGEDAEPFEEPDF